MYVITGSSQDVTSYKNMLRLASVTVLKESPSTELDYPDFNNPFFENVFEERTTRLEMPKASQLMSWGTDRSALLKFRNEQPYLSLFHQSGKVYVLASPLENA